ncbi:hypothetical protein AB0D34_36150 [Streptomyces sp. NPDC048420]|uniref:hypothetical protein n=1 Tax=Streptomyces sp. NPDC048420 TaxID=3155755 RepID=UPI00341AD5B4
MILDGTLIKSVRLAGVRDNDNDNDNELWFSQEHKAFGGNAQFLSAPDGTPLWVCDVEPGSTPDITAGRIHALPAPTRQQPTAYPPRPTGVTPAPGSASPSRSGVPRAGWSRPCSRTRELRTA